MQRDTYKDYFFFSDKHSWSSGFNEEEREREGYFSLFLIGGIKMWLKLGCKVHTENEKGAYKKELLIETYLTLAILSISYKKGTQFYHKTK